jgi:hypothetical protein
VFLRLQVLGVTFRNAGCAYAIGRRNDIFQKTKKREPEKGKLEIQINNLISSLVENNVANKRKQKKQINNS